MEYERSEEEGEAIMARFEGRTKRRKDIIDGITTTFIIVAILALVVWGFGAFMTGADVNKWDKIDTEGDCYLHITKVNDAMWTPGHDNPEERTIFCHE